MAGPGRALGGADLVGGDLEGLGDQRLELGVIQARRRGTVGVFVLLRVAGILIVGHRG